MNRKVSVIMGIYNCATTLPQAIESILAQTYTDWELIMCDDGSSDDTYEIASKYAEKCGNIILLRNEKNLKLAATLNRCLEVASGEYIARMDADDESLPERFEKEVLFLDEHPEIACVGTGLVVFDEKGEHGTRIGNEHPRKTCMVYGVPFAHPTIMMRKSAYDSLNGYVSAKETLRAEDVDLWFRFFEKGYRGYILQEILYRYRESSNDFKKRTMEAAIGTTKVCLRGYRLLDYPIYYYPFAFKPIIVAAMPKKIVEWYHRKKDK